MRKRQKLILILYSYMIVALGFIYVPYVRNLHGGEVYIGHHLRFNLFQMEPVDALWGSVRIDSGLMLAELLAVTAVMTVAYLLFKRDK